VLSKSTKPGIQARACASLAHNLKYRARLLRALAEDQEMRKSYEKTFGKPLLTAFLKQKPDDLSKESVTLFEQVVKKHGDVKHPIHGSLANLAKTHLESLREPITLDKPAPEITGIDVAGKPMKLSDFKGKVVMLDFWGHNFPASQVMYEYEGQLVKRLADKPFVLLGVNSDPDREAVAKTVEANKITWRSWWDNGDVGGPIASRWDVDQWPTLILIDHKGIIRHIDAGWPERKEMDEVVNKLVAEASKAAK
jgi:peroxiredoxin